MTKRDNKQQESAIFVGFDPPTSNWFRMPNNWTDVTSEINNLAEIKIVEYILRHTWGYQEYGLKKHITIDEFVNGRRRQDGSRMDYGTGLSERAVYDGLRKAVDRGLIEEEIDDRDRGRVKKWYSLRMRVHSAVESEAASVQLLHSGVQTLHPHLQESQLRGAESASRTEKETLERTSLSNIRKRSRQEKSTDQRGTSSETWVDADDQRTQQAAATQTNNVGTHVSGMTALSETIAQRQQQRPKLHGPRQEQSDNEQNGIRADAPSRPRVSRPRQVVQQDEVYQVIQAYIADFSRELNDRAPLKSSTTRAYNLYKRSGLDQEAFIAQLYAARAIVKERSAMIRTSGVDNAAGFPVTHRAGYYFAVLEDLLGFRESQVAAGNASAARKPDA